MKKLLFLILISQVALLSFFTYEYLGFSAPLSSNRTESYMADLDEEALDSPHTNYRSHSATRSMPLAKQTSSSSPMGSLLVQSAHAQEEKSKYLIKTGNINAKVESISELKKTLLSSLKEAEAFIQSENESQNNRRLSLNLSIKVPSANFDSLMEVLSQKASFLDSKSSQIEDVMKQFLETEERIKSKKLLREKFRKLLSSSKRIEDTLKIERELSKIQRELEYAKKSLENLKDQISLSTIHAHFYQEKALQEQKSKTGILTEISNALSRGLSRVKSFILMLISFWPFILLIIFGVFLFRKLKD